MVGRESGEETAVEHWTKNCVLRGNWLSQRTLLTLRRGLGGDSMSALWPPYSVKVNMVPAPNPTSSTCLPPVGNFSQRISLIRERRNVETGKQSRPNNDNVVITHSQGLLVLSQGL